MDFEQLLVKIFGADFIEAFKRKRPAGWVDLLLAFESRKRAATPFKSKPLNVSLPFSFTDYHQKYRVSSQDMYSMRVGAMGQGSDRPCNCKSYYYKDRKVVIDRRRPWEAACCVWLAVSRPAADSER